MSSFSAAGGRSAYLWVLLLALAAALAIYKQTISFGYVGYDDKIITRSGQQIERGLTAGSLKRIFVPGKKATYQPLRDLAVETVYQFSGTDPAGYHWFNLLMFLANLAAVFWLLCRLLPLFGMSWPGGEKLWAAAGAAWFAVHPIHVEAVAWMNSNKELLSGLFYFLALGFYLASRGGDRFWPAYLASWLCFLLGLLAKPSGAAFPLVLAALELSVQSPRRPDRKAVYRIGPFVLLSVIAGVYFVFRSSTGTGVWLQESLPIHALSMASVLGRYVITMLLPVNLCHSYPPPFFFGHYDWRLALYLVLDLSLIAGAWLGFRRGERTIAFGIIFFLLNLLPVSGIVPIAVFRADRYLYIPSLGLILAGLAAVRYLFAAASPGRARTGIVAGSTLTLVLLGALAHHRCGDWRDSISLWKSAVHTHGNYQFNYFGLGNAYYGRGMLPEALQAFRDANRFQDNFQCHYLSAVIFDKLGEPDSARAHLETAERMFTPDMLGQMEEMTDIYRRLGHTRKLADHLARWGAMRLDEPGFVISAALELAKTGSSSRAVELLEKAGRKLQDQGGFYLSATRKLIENGDFEAAEGALELAGKAGGDRTEVEWLQADLAFSAGDWERAVAGYSETGVDSLDPGRLERLAAACLRSGRKARALELFRSLAQSGDSPTPAQLNNVGAVLEAMDSLEAAEDYFRSAVELDSSYADAWYNLGRVLTSRGKLQPALDCYLRSCRLEEENPETGLAVARLLARMGRNEEAIESYGRLVHLEPRNMGLLLEAADFAWNAGNRGVAAQYYARLLAAAGDRGLPARVSARAKY